MDTKKRILMQAKLLFSQYGIRNVTMDIIAQELGISKKTLYQYFEDKAAIVFEMVKEHQEEQKETMQELTKSAKNAVEALANILHYIDKLLRFVSPLLLFELHKYYPAAANLMREDEAKFHLPSIRENLVSGIKEGLFREDIDIEVIAQLRLGMLDIAMDSRRYPLDNYSPHKVHIELFRFYIYGLLTDKGRELWEKVKIQN